jgi:hypothetical protein
LGAAIVKACIDKEMQGRCQRVSEAMNKERGAANAIAVIEKELVRALCHCGRCFGVVARRML